MNQKFIFFINGKCVIQCIILEVNIDIDSILLYDENYIMNSIKLLKMRINYYE